MKYINDYFDGRNSPQADVTVCRIIVPHSCHFQTDDLKNSCKRKYPNNKILTTKYRWWNFVFKNLYEQFYRWANFYFVFLICINFVPVINAFAKEAQVVPVLIVLVVTMLKDGYEDYCRYAQDRIINTKSCGIYNQAKNKYVRRHWAEVCVGDMLHISCNDVIPADILLLNTSDPCGVCFIETSNLDGEPNLKQREVVEKRYRGARFQPTDFTSTIECELPNNDINRFNGCIVDVRGQRSPITNDNLLLRGCTLRNTNYAEGIVLYAGHETKALLNNRGPRTKRSKLEKRINRDVIWCVVLLSLLCLGGALGHGIWLSKLGDLDQAVFITLESDENKSPVYQGFITLLNLLIHLQVMIPLPMYCTLELVKLGQVYFIQEDIETYDEVSDKRLECRALNMTEDLGQVQYIFSDKTGTLTDNRMVFRYCTIGGVDYSKQGMKALSSSCDDDFPSSVDVADDEVEFVLNDELKREVSRMQLLKQDRAVPAHMQRICDFFVLLTVCNTVIVSSKPHEDDTPAAAPPSDEDADSLPLTEFSKPHMKNDFHNGYNIPDLLKGPEITNGDVISRPSVGNSVASDGTSVCYEAESPDELALVRAALAYGCRLVRRSPGSVSISTAAEGELTFTVLNVLRFDADRKCMSVIVQYPASSDIVLLCKGADTAILSKLAMDRDCRADGGYEEMVHRTDEHISQFARLGLRTLCMAKKIISRAEYNEWSTKYRAALSSLVDRDVKVQAVVSQIENNLTLIGGTALEDSLQEGVPDAIVSLREAGLNIWVLTGDKQETAINVAYSCKLITPDQRLIFINVTCSKSAEEEVRRYLRKLSNISSKLQKNSGDRSAVRTKGDMQDHKLKQNYALIIDGVSLALVMESVSTDFLQLAEQCLSVLCCRATPIQKAEVVKLVKEKLKVLTLAIGDGANDVSMIQTADVGVGISGQEGMQAVMASDFAMARFRFLKRLLLVHGHWCYDRLARTALYMFYKSAAYVFVLFWYQLFNGFSASSSVDPYYTIFHNLFYTGFPPAAVGIWDQNLPASVLMSKPTLYKSGQLCKSYQGYSYFLNILDALWQSAVVFFVTYLAYMNATVDMSEFGVTCITSCVVCALCTIALEIKSFNVVIWLSLLLSVVLMWLTMSLTALFAVTTDPPLNPYWVFFNTVASPLYWLCIILSTVAAIVPRLCLRAFKATLSPSPSSVERQSVIGSLSKNSNLARFRCDSELAGFPARRASQAQVRCKSSKSLRDLPTTTHIAHIPALVSRSVPLLERTSSASKTLITFDRKSTIEIEV